jgi:hypothetical protein
MLKTFIDAIIVLMLVVLAFSPALVYRAVDKYFFQKKDINLFARDIFNEPVEIDFADGESGFNQEISFEKDEKILKNLKAMVKNTRKRKVKKMWKIKLGEFERRLKWQTTMEKTNDHETLPVS